MEPTGCRVIEHSSNDPLFLLQNEDSIHARLLRMPKEPFSFFIPQNLVDLPLLSEWAIAVGYHQFV